jgi:hypothetical protein
VSLVIGLVEGSLSARPPTSDGRGRCCGSTYPSSSGLHWTKIQAKALLGNGVDANNDDVSRYRGPPWRRLLECFLLGLCLPGENLSPVLRRGDDDGIDIVSLLGASLWNSC